MFRSQRVRSVFLTGVLVISILAGAGCQKSTRSKETATSQSESKETTVTQSESSETVAASSSSESTEKQESSSEIKETTKPTSDESSEDEKLKQDALKLAEELGVKEEELHGKYDLFIKYTDCINQNTDLGFIEDYVLHLFPVLADHLKPEDESFFFSRLSNLKAVYGESATRSAGEYHIDDNMILMNELGDTTECFANYDTMYHELMHFIDHSVGTYRSHVYYTGKQFAHGEELTDQEWGGEYVSLEEHFIVEGGADYYTGKYYRKAIDGYLAASFLSGIEWVYGAETVDRLFFNSDSTMEYIRLLQDAGIPDQKIVDSIVSFNYETNNRYDAPENSVRFEDILIDLYESKKDTGWKDDKVFMQILNEIHAWTLSLAEYPFTHEELNSLLLDTQALEKKSQNVMDQIDQRTSQELIHFFKLILLDGKPYLSETLFTSDEFDRTEPTTLIVEYDFDQEKVISYKYYVPDYPKWIN